MNQAISGLARDLKIDIMKGLFVIGMVWSHVSGYTGVRENRWVDGAWNIFAVVTFSGFIFCMGYVMQISYFDQTPPPVQKMLRSTWRTLIGYYIAALGYFAIVRHEFDWPLIRNVLLLRQFGNISEFLLAFALIPLVSLALTRPIRCILASERRFFLAVFLLLMTPFIPVNFVHSPYLALFIGSSQGIYYPVLQYYVFFLLGAYYASREVKVGWMHIAISLLCLTIFVGAYVNNNMFSRFPPSFAWLVLGGGGLFLWYWVAERLSAWPFPTKILAPIGANSLFFLVTSNLMIFSTRETFRNAVGVSGASILALVILVSSFALMRFVRPLKI